MTSNEKIAKLLVPYGFAADECFSNAVLRYIELLLQWNRKISLTTVTDPVEIVKFHFGESIFALSSVPIREGRLADVGSGAGFPGLPLAMAKPDLHVTLIESNAKKAAFLSEAVRELGLRNVRVAHNRMESFRTDADSFDVVAARAVGKYEDILQWAAERLSDHGKLVLWLGESDALGISKQKYWKWGPPSLIPNSKRRFLLVGGPARS